MIDVKNINTKQLKTWANKLGLPLVLIAVVFITYQFASAVYYLTLAPSFSAGEYNNTRAGRGERWSWFQAERKAAPKKVVKQENITESNIRAELKGIIELGERSVAIIHIGGKQDKDVFGVGDKLKGNVTIEAIEPNRVLIRENGNIRSLTMKENAAEIALSGKRQDNLPVDEGVGKSLNQVAGINSPVLAGINFVQTDNGETGMSLGSINPQMLEGTDLRADDVIVSAGGNSVQQIMASPTSYQSLLRSDSLDVTIIRNGEEEIVNINPRSVAPNVMRMIGQNR